MSLFMKKAYSISGKREIIVWNKGSEVAVSIARMIKNGT